MLIAAVSLKSLLYVAPPAVLAAAAGLIRVGGVPLAQLAVQRLRWWHGTPRGYTSYRAEVVLQHTGVLQLPGTLAATELLSAEDGRGGRYGLVRDRHTGYLTATLRVVPVSTWLADTGDADRWVANWGAWLASLGYLPALRWVTVTVDTAPDPGIHAHRPGRRRDRPLRAPGRCRDHGPAGRRRPGRGSRRGHPGQHHLRPGRLTGPARRPSATR